MTLRARRFAWSALFFACAWLASAASAEAQVCPAGRYCFYVPSGLPYESSHSSVSSRQFDIVISSPVRTVAGTYTIGTGAAIPFSVTPGNSERVPLGANGPASGYDVAERRGVFIVADSPDLTIDHRETFDQEQYSETIKRHEIALGTRFRLGGYSLNREDRPGAAIDAVLIYAPSGGTVTLRAPPGATLPFWNGSASADYVATLSEGQTLAVRSLVGRDIDGALLTSSAPVAVSSGGRGWSTAGCGDDGMDGLVPVSALGTEHVVRLPTGSYEGNDESRVRVIADVDGTEVQVNGATVATLTAGSYYQFRPTALSHVRTSRPALVWMNGSVDGCEVDTVLIPPIAFAPALTELSLDFNVPASDQTPAGEFAMLIAAADVASIRLDGAAPALISNESVPLRPDLSYVRFNVSPGNRNVRAGSDFQALLASRTEPSGLLAYYNPYRIPGCGDGAVDPSEACDDGNLRDGDGCSSSCQVEPGYACAGAPSSCATACGNGAITPPIESCDDGNAIAGDGCNVNCRREVTITMPSEGAVSRDGLPLIAGSADVGASVTIAIGDLTTTVSPDAMGRFELRLPSPLADGTYTVRASASDVRGGASMAMRTIVVDSGTRLSIDEPANGAVVRTPTPTVRGSGEPGARVELRVDGAPVGSVDVDANGRWELTPSAPLASGVRVLTAEAQDPTGNRASAGPLSITIDDSTFVRFTQPTAGARVESALPELRGEGEPGATATVTLDGRPLGTVTMDGDGLFRIRVPSPLGEGEHVAAIESSDAAGNRASSTVAFTVDTMRAPILFILNLPDGAFTRDPQPTFSGVADPGSHVLVSIDGVLLDTLTSTARGAWSVRLLSVLAPGVHTLEASTTDAWGNSVSDRHSFTYVAESAELQLTEPRQGSVLADSTPIIAGSARAGARVQIAIDDTPIGETSARPDGSWSLELMVPLSDGRHAVRATADDGSLHVATVEVGFFIDTSTFVEILRPGEGQRVGPRTLFAGTAEPLAIVTLELDGSVIAEIDTGADGSFAHAPTSPLAIGPHVLRVRALDMLGNRAEDSAAFTVELTVGDEDGDGRPDAEECASEPCPDLDGDGLPNVRDEDDDGDGVPTVLECPSAPCRDSDGDQQPDYLDADDDDDGRPSAEERASDGSTRDSDRDGLLDRHDPDDDGDGLSTRTECPSAPCVDSDGDGAPDYLDFDDDNDGVPSARERADGTRLGDSDADRDGRVHWLDPDANNNGGDDGADGVGDADGDGVPDYLDGDTPAPPPFEVTSPGYAVAGGGGCSAVEGGSRSSWSVLLLTVLALGAGRGRARRRAA